MVERIDLSAIEAHYKAATADDLDEVWDDVDRVFAALREARRLLEHGRVFAGGTLTPEEIAHFSGPETADVVRAIDAWLTAVRP